MSPSRVLQPPMARRVRGRNALGRRWRVRPSGDQGCARVKRRTTTTITRRLVEVPALVTIPHRRYWRWRRWWRRRPRRFWHWVSGRDVCHGNTDVSGAGNSTVSGSGGARFHLGGGLRTKRQTITESRGPFRPAAIQSHPPDHLSAVAADSAALHSLRVYWPPRSVAWVVTVELQRERHHTLMARPRRPPLPWPSRSGRATWTRSSGVRANAPYPSTRAGTGHVNIAEVTSSLKLCMSAPTFAIIRSLPPGLLLSPVRRIFFLLFIYFLNFSLRKCCFKMLY